MTTSHAAFAFSLIVLVVIAGCASEQDTWEDAQAEGSVASYEAFLAEYPDGELSGDARARIQALDFEMAQMVDSIAAFEGFLESYSSGEFVAEAEAMLEELYLREAEAANSIAAFEDFLARDPDSKLAEQATDRIKALRVLARAGQWDGRTAFGSMTFVVSPSGEEVTDLEMNWAVGGMSGNVEFSDNFSLPIDDSGRFEIILPNSLTFWGEFAAERPLVTGFWETKVPMRSAPLRSTWEIDREKPEPPA